MTDPDQPHSEARLAIVPTDRRKFLAIVDDSKECRAALRYVAQRAKHTGGIVTLLRVIAPAQHQHWAGVEDAMRDEAHADAEAFLHRSAAEIKAITQGVPELIIREGTPHQEIRTVIEGDPSIDILVLAAADDKAGPGDLVTAITTGSGGSLPIPVTIVPGFLSDAEIDEHS